MKVLLIEDEDDMAELAVRVITLPHPLVGEIVCHRSDNLSDGVDRLFCENYDAVILDLVLPDSPMEKTISTLSKISCLVPIIVMTGHDSRQIVRDCVKNGAKDFILKTQDMSQLQHAVIRCAFEGEMKNYELNRVKRLALMSIEIGLHETFKDMQSIRTS